MLISEIGRVLSSETRCSLLEIVDRPMSLTEISSLYNGRVAHSLRKETIYRHLENLVRSNLLTKQYYSFEKTLKYERRLTRICVDLSRGAARVLLDGEVHDRK